MSMVCEPVKDLAPLYMDGACSEVTGNFIKKHLKKCKCCSEYYKLCRRSMETAEKRTKTNSGNTDLIYAPDDGYELVARRVKKSIIADRIAMISAAVAALVTIAVIFAFKTRKDR